MLAQRKTHVLILICLWAAFSGVLTPFLGPWGAVIAGAGATQLAYRIARPLLADAKSLWATGMIFTWVGAIALTVHDWRIVGAGTGIVESLCLAFVAAAGTVWLVRKAKLGVAAFQAEFKASSLKAAEIRERAAAERAERSAGRPEGFDGLGLRRSARLGSLTTTLLDHARKTVAEGRPAEGAVADVRAKLAKDPGLLPLLHYNVGRAEVDDTVRAAAAALLAEVAGPPPQSL
ncbi:hypothetical protein GCM10010302_09770 [Streptomyces polychromogenes]|uniref:Uncharacterized protein n=1 Tax=Streptomyces polychromogenes TaxID=67342 RepID=A0ABP3ESZ4_9ACTN